MQRPWAFQLKRTHTGRKPREQANTTNATPIHRNSMVQFNQPNTLRPTTQFNPFQQSTLVACSWWSDWRKAATWDTKCIWSKACLVCHQLHPGTSRGINKSYHINVYSSWLKHVSWKSGEHQNGDEMFLFNQKWPRNVGEWPHGNFQIGRSCQWPNVAHVQLVIHTGLVKCMSCFLFTSPQFVQASGLLSLPLGYLSSPFDLQPAGPFWRRCWSSHEVCSQAPPDSDGKNVTESSFSTYCTGSLLLKIREVQPFLSLNFVH